MNKLGLYGISLLAIVALGLSMLFIVDQREWGVVNQFGKVQHIKQDPGLHWKWPPPVQNVTYLDKRLLTLESHDTEPLWTKEKRRVIVEWFVRWRITDPLTYINNVGRSESYGAMQLDRVLRNAVQEEINHRTVKEIISDEREALMQAVKDEVTAAVEDGKSWGLEVVDFRITRADYVSTIAEEVYRRMRAERQRVANELRSTGVAEGEQIRADADRQREVIVADAYREAQTTRGEGDGRANEIYARAFNNNPDFAEFYRSLGAYQDSIGKAGDVLVIDPAESQFFRDFRTGLQAPIP